MRLRIFEKMPARLAWILEQDRVGVSILEQERRPSNLVVPISLEQEVTNIARRASVAFGIATGSLHAPLPYESCRIHALRVSLPHLAR